MINKPYVGCRAEQNLFTQRSGSKGDRDNMKAKGQFFILLQSQFSLPSDCLHAEDALAQVQQKDILIFQNFTVHLLRIYQLRNTGHDS